MSERAPSLAATVAAAGIGADADDPWSLLAATVAAEAGTELALPPALLEVVAEHGGLPELAAVASLRHEQEGSPARWRP